MRAAELSGRGGGAALVTEAMPTELKNNPSILSRAHVQRILDSSWNCAQCRWIAVLSTKEHHIVS